MKVTKQETLYHEDHGATLKQKCEKKDSSIVLFLGLSFFIWPSPFFYLGQYSIIDDHHTSIYLQLDTRTKYDSI